MTLNYYTNEEIQLMEQYCILVEAISEKVSGKIMNESITGRLVSIHSTIVTRG